MTWHEFITMGGYGQYVWPAFIITLVIIGLNVVLALRLAFNIKHQLRQHLKHHELSS